MKWKLILLASLLFIMQVCFAQTKEVLTNKSVSDLVKAGLDYDIVISKIGSTSCKFDLSTAGLVALKKDGVPSDIIKAMQDKAGGKGAATASIPQQAANAEPPQHAKSKAIPAIALVNVPYGYDDKANTIRDLEKVTGEVKPKLTAKSVFLTPVGGGPIDEYFRGNGVRSPVRFLAKDSTSFVVNSDKGTPDVFTFYKMEGRKGKRETVYQKDNTAIAANKNTKNTAIPFRYVLLGNNIYRIIPTQPLEPGEYCFVFEFSGATYRDNRMDGYAFGID